jgi:hypothetical protein
MREVAAPDAKQIAWMAVATGAGALAAWGVRKGLEQAWRAATHEEPPGEPSSHDVPWREAILWTVATGALGALGQLLARRGTEAAWHRLMGEHPPTS